LSLRLYDGKNIWVKFYDTYQERLNFINKEIFSKSKYNNYYNITDPSLFQDNSNEISNRWLGIKIINRPNKNEHTKVILDFLSGYLAGSRDHSYKIIIKRYYELLDIIKNTKENKEKESALEEISRIKVNFLYIKNSGDKRDFIFYENIPAEEFITKNILRFKSKKKKSRTDNFMMYDLMNRLNIATYSKNKCLEYKDRISKNLKEKEELIKLLKVEYELIEKNDDNFDNITYFLRRINEIEEENYYFDQEIQNFYDNYLYSTEYILKK
jgi:hypothetical protein